MNADQMADIIEIQQLLARYAVGVTLDDQSVIASCFAPDGTYSAFGTDYPAGDVAELAAAAPRGLLMTGAAEIVLDGDRARGRQPQCLIIQADHNIRLGCYTDTYVRTVDGWRIQTRATTFLRRSGARDSGEPHDPRRPIPSVARPDERE